MGPWRTILLAIVAIVSVVVVLYLDRPEGVTKEALGTIALIAGGGALYRYMADRGKGSEKKEEKG